MLLDAPTLAAVAALALAAAVVGGVGGFGTGVILTAALVPLIGVKAVVPVLAVAGVIINAGRFWFYRDSLDRRALATVLAASLPLLVLGAWLYSVLDARAVGTLLALVIIASVPARRVLKARAMVLGTPGLAVGAGVWGVASGFASGTGMILISTLLGAGLSGTTVLATDALATIVFDLSKALLFRRFELLDDAAVLTGLAIGAATIPGSALAKWLVHRMGARLHVLAMEALILAGGAFMLWHAWR
ncbi:MAG TPA: sulfite exporter TauE/SafE family protein [Burkholderiales bacterium]|nr:sulfite exporter TauE/SafE family protein [Burkholderiales bacterium]